MKMPSVELRLTFTKENFQSTLAKIGLLTMKGAFIAEFFDGEKKETLGSNQDNFEPGTEVRSSDATCTTIDTQFTGVAAKSISVLNVVSCFGTYHAE